MDFLSKLNARYATKVFDATKKISETDMEKLLEAIRLSASSLGLQPYKVLVVKDPAIRAELRKVAWNQSQITDASVLLVFAVDYAADEKTADDFIDLIAQTRNVTAESLSGYGDMIKGTIKKLNAEQLETWVSKTSIYCAWFRTCFGSSIGT